MSPEVTVHVNRGSDPSLETPVDAVSVRESFDLLLEGHDSPAHVHCRLDDELARIATLETSNYYVEPGAGTVVPVQVTTDGITDPVTGELEVMTGYGSESLSIPVTVDPASGAIDVDDSLADPRRRDSEVDPTLLERIVAETGLEPATLGVLALGVVAMVVGTAVAMTIGGPTATAGIGILVAGIVVALFLLIR